MLLHLYVKSGWVSILILLRLQVSDTIASTSPLEKKMKLEIWHIVLAVFFAAPGEI
jgi:hypothetical protein